MTFFITVYELNKKQRFRKLHGQVQNPCLWYYYRLCAFRRRIFGIQTLPAPTALCTGNDPPEKKLPTLALANEACVAAALGRVNPQHPRWLDVQCRHYSTWKEKDNDELTRKVMDANCPGPSCTGNDPPEKKLPTLALANEACVAAALGRLNPQHPRWLDLHCKHYSSWPEKDHVELTKKVMEANCPGPSCTGNDPPDVKLSTPALANEACVAAALGRVNPKHPRWVDVHCKHYSSWQEKDYDELTQKVMDANCPIESKCTGNDPPDVKLSTPALANEACVSAALGRVNPQHPRWVDVRCKHYSTWQEKDNDLLTLKVMDANCPGGSKCTEMDPPEKRLPTTALANEACVAAALGRVNPKNPRWLAIQCKHYSQASAKDHDKLTQAVMEANC